MNPDPNSYESRKADILRHEPEFLKQELHPIDQRQVELWAEALQLPPQEVLERLLLSGWDPVPGLAKTVIDDGRFVELMWDWDWLPLQRMEWVPDLSIRKLRFPRHGAKPTPLLTLDQMPLRNLELLDCSGVRLKNLDLSETPNLGHLNCSGCGLKSLDLSRVPRLKVLDCAANKLTALRLQGLADLSDLDCSQNQLTELALPENLSLTKLNCNSNRLSKLVLGATPNLTDLRCGDNGLTDLVFEEAPKLKHLECSFNDLTQLVLPHSPNLTTLDCSFNGLTQLVLTRAPSLATLECSYNQLPELALTESPGLTNLVCVVNRLPALDIRPFSQLEYLFCDPEAELMFRSDQQHGLCASEEAYLERRKRATVLHQGAATLLEIIAAERSRPASPRGGSTRSAITPAKPSGRIRINHRGTSAY